MSEKLEELPLFPLTTVLFPYSPLQLHVFEDRYRQMIRKCVDEDLPFGVVLIRSGSEAGGDAEPYMVGTVVRIVRVYTFEDGCLDVHVQGERRFRIRRLDHSKPYLVGHVEPVIELDLGDGEQIEPIVERLRDDFRLYVEGHFARPDFKVQVRFPSDPIALSFTIANWLSIENLEKQRLLELTDTRERLEDLSPILQRSLLEAKHQVLQRLVPSDLQEWISPN